RRRRGCGRARMRAAGRSCPQSTDATVPYLLAARIGRYPPRTMRRVEIRLLDGPNLYRLEPAVKIELAVGRRRTWFGDRLPEAHARVRLGATVRPADAPEPIAAVAAWAGRLHRLARADGWLAAEGRRGRVPVTIHRTSEPGHWV